MSRALTIWDFEGAWTYAREIDDATGLGAGAGQGTARFIRQDGALRYDEEGQIAFATTPPMKGSRRYLWRETPAGAAVFFEDGRAFHDVDLRQGSPAAAHWCDPDQYDVTYDFSDWPRWSSLWRVKGPRKDYTMRTTYHRPGAATEG
ncbi:DUF6314 family protein [Primorskyibacter sp. 2E107]|uniref:DUF6314 family protein n=1 Tax=Primorskyibacter sp. 2E107 TaxID=3403458 RepID=UPI003AF8C3C2